MTEYVAPKQGDKLLFVPVKGDKVLTLASEKPLDGTVLYVWGPKLVNVRVTDHAGKEHVMPSVRILEHGELVPGNGYYAFVPAELADAKTEPEPSALAVGDVVRLKSGGPRMTVGKVFKDTRDVNCGWMVDEELKVDMFPAGMLEVLSKNVAEPQKATAPDKARDQATEALMSAVDMLIEGTDPHKQPTTFIGITQGIEWVGAPPCALPSSTTVSAVDESLITSNPRADEGVTSADVAAAMEQCGKEASAFLRIEQRPQKVSGDDIEAMVKRLNFVYVERPNGSNTTFCHAFLDGFFVASGLSMCVDPKAFDAALGRMNATDNAIQAARDKLWEFEGYVLHCRRQGRIGAPHVTINGNVTRVVLGEDGPLMAEGVARSADLDIGGAARALRDGKRVARRGWNGKDMWLSMTHAQNVEADQFWNGPNREYANTMPDKIAHVPASITFKSGPGVISMGWNATAADVLASDWYVVEDAKAYDPMEVTASTGHLFNVHKRVPLEAR